MCSNHTLGISLVRAFLVYIHTLREINFNATNNAMAARSGTNGSIFFSAQPRTAFLPWKAVVSRRVVHVPVSSSSGYKWVVLSNTTLATLMSSLDINIVIIAIPTIGKNLRGTSLLDLLWILLGYQVVIASLLVNFGRLSDIFGRVRLYNIGFAVFGVGSALCSFSQNGTELVIFRMIQGLGAAFLISNAAAIIVDTFPANERGKALGINRVSQIGGAAGGLVLGGFLTTVVGWRSIFWINIPIAIFGVMWSHYKLKELGTLEKSSKIDLPGNIMFASMLASFLVGISLYALGYLNIIYFGLLMAVGTVLFISFVIVENKIKDPMLRLSLFRIRAFSGGSFATFLNALARGCLFLVLTFYLQGASMNLDPLIAGLFLLPNSIAISISGPIGGWLSDRGNLRFYTTLGQLLTFAGFIVLAQIGQTINFVQLLIPLVLIGVGQGFFSSPNRASVISSVPPSHRGVGSAVNSMLFQVGNSFSRAFSFLVIGLVVPGSVLATLFLGASSVVTNSQFEMEFVFSLHILFYVCAGIMLLSIFPSIMRGKTGGYETVLEEPAS